ncbi:hypothetical protein [Parabacteroides chongii]|uniref:hypothetical protein n=1 Tax=Parabacteroides chongii TaxID=2685834 RepID=UPI00240E3C89|nr:hypothetical protein [Parabacteroides chongii]WFE83196.1 hypothetical protein P3L47_13695 [Parabacteroides chongii]
MTAMELQQWRENFIEKYLNKMDSLETMAKLEKYAKRIMTKKTITLSPIAYSLEEANQEIDQAEKELHERKGINETGMLQFFAKKENPRPCVVHSQEEMIAAIRESEEAIERGEYITDEELSEEIKTWWK